MSIYFEIAVVILSFGAGILICFARMRRMEKKIVNLELNMLNDQDEILKLRAMLGKIDAYTVAVYDSEQSRTKLSRATA